jgi:hypothetical protein
VKAIAWSASSIASWSDGEERTESMQRWRDSDDDELGDLPRNKKRDVSREMRTIKGSKRRPKRGSGDSLRHRNRR